MARDCYDDCIAFLDEQLGGCSTSCNAGGSREHGGDHHLGPRRSVRRSWLLRPLLQRLPRCDRRPAGDPLSPRAPGRVVSTPSACATCRRPWSTCWASRPARRSRAARWRPTGASGPGTAPEATSPALSEQADATAFQPQPRPGREHPGFQMSLVASGHHYIRDGMGPEQLYDLQGRSVRAGQPHGFPDGGRRVGAFRKMLLEVLTENPGSVEVERAYLEPYREWLEDLVQDHPEPIATTAPVAACFLKNRHTQRLHARGSRAQRTRLRVSPVPGPPGSFTRHASVPTPRQRWLHVTPANRSLGIRRFGFASPGSRSGCPISRATHNPAVGPEQTRPAANMT